MNNPKEWPLSGRLRYRWDIARLVCARWWLHVRLTCAGLFVRRPSGEGLSNTGFVATEPNERSRRGWILATVAGMAGIILLLFFLWSGDRGANNSGEGESGKTQLASLGSADEEPFVPPQQEPSLGRDATVEAFQAPEDATHDAWSTPVNATTSGRTETSLLVENEKPRQKFKVFNPDETTKTRDPEADDSDLALRDEKPEKSKVILGGVTPRIIVQPDEEERLGIEKSPTLSESLAVVEEESDPVRNEEPALEIADEKVAQPVEEKRSELAFVEEEPQPARREVRTRIVEERETPEAETPRSVDDEPIIATEPKALESESIPWRRSVTPRRNTTTVVPAADPFDQPLEPMQPVSGTVPTAQEKNVPPERARRTGGARVEVVRTLPDGSKSSSGSMSYEIIVRNRGTAAVEQMTVEERIPAGLRVTGSNPPGTVEGRVIRWELSDLGPASEEVISVSLGSDRVAEPSRRAPEVRARRETPTQAGSPSLRVKMEAPSRLQRGQTGYVRFYVMNAGTGAAQRVQISTDLPKYLSHPKGPALVQDLGTIAPGETRIIDLRVTAIQPGSGEQRVTVTASGNLRQESAAEISVLDQVTSMAGCVRLFN